jgi:hypothetical protein
MSRVSQLAYVVLFTMSSKSKSKSNRNNSRRPSRRNGNKQWSSQGPLTVRPRLLGGFPDRARVTLRYNSTQINAAITTVPSSQVIRGNGPFDPDATSTGSQPNNYDDYALQYNRYRVYGARVKVWISIQSATLNCSAILSARHTSTAISGIATFENAQSNPYVKRRQVSIQTNATARPHLSMQMSTSKFLAVPIEDPDIASLVSTTPAHPWYFHINVINADYSTNTSFTVSWEIDYDIEFWDRLEQSLDSLALRVERLRLLRAERALKRAPAPNRVTDTKEGLLPSTESVEPPPRGWF